MEREADYIGLQLMARACYDPTEMPKVFLIDDNFLHFYLLDFFLLNFYVLLNCFICVFFQIVFYIVNNYSVFLFLCMYLYLIYFGSVRFIPMSFLLYSFSFIFCFLLV